MTYVKSSRKGPSPSKLHMPYFAYINPLKVTSDREFASFKVNIVRTFHWEQEQNLLNTSLFLTTQPSRAGVPISQLLLCGPGRPVDRLCMCVYLSVCKNKQVKVWFLYSAAYAITGPARFTISEVAVDWQEPIVLQRKLRPSNCTC